MGQTGSRTKRLNRSQREEREQLKHSNLQRRKENIQKFQEQVVFKPNDKQIISVNELSMVIQLGETAKVQLDRGGSTLTKSDLVAIVIALEPRLRKELRSLSELTNADLNAMIRSIIYDPNRIFQNTSDPGVIKDEPKFLINN